MSVKVATFYVSDDVDKINEKLESIGLNADAVISILHEAPGRAFSTTNTSGRFQVLYRQPEEQVHSAPQELAS